MSSHVWVGRGKSSVIGSNYYYNYFYFVTVIFHLIWSGILALTILMYANLYGKEAWKDF